MNREDWKLIGWRLQDFVADNPKPFMFLAGVFVGYLAGAFL